jgi:glycosyltransferase involved in cell wall biosynthesis
LISIVLPCHNGERYLEQSIRSCLGQKYKNWELILVDDGSVDRSREIMENFVLQDKRISLVSNPINRNLPASLNIGFTHAHGEYFTWTSDDNRYHPDTLAELLKALLDGKADAVYSGFAVIDENDGFIINYIRREPEIMVCKSVVGASFLYTRELHEKLHGYDEAMFLIEDYDFWLRAYLSGFKIIKIDKILYDYRDHTGSLSYTRTSEVAKAAFRRILLNVDELDKFPQKYRKIYWSNLADRVKYDADIADVKIFIRKNYGQILKYADGIRFLWRCLRLLCKHNMQKTSHCSRR